ncbi:hypothetical protein [Aminobacter aminovorans]|uniref:Uncharacterized protein n=1 Tax=Aminobacter aminovorans TaxID=83263 RepID=A0AAC9AR40_AMIAI|nr:hypothetical protein [Aminobacter aminovorans]AMS41237.1 hypothetical protein AA2016_2310 [Aminobacter aminovorans]MBB3705780.1 hypothetical protein [Aminobacter aminovorans]
MTPVVVHRYSWLITEAIEALLGEVAGDAEGWRMRVEGDELVVDIVAPVRPQAPAEGRPAASAQAAKINMAPAEPESNSVNSLPEKPVQGQPELKGGALARSAAIMGGEKGFWIFAEKKHGVFLASADDARAWFCKTCGINSRAELDHDPRAAEIFKPIEKAYRLWLEGYD